MSLRRQKNGLRSGLWIGCAVVAVCLVAWACSKSEVPSIRSSAEAVESRQPADRPAVQPPPQAQRTEADLAGTMRQPAVTEPPGPQVPDNIKAACRQPEPPSEEYAARLEARRSLLHELRHGGQTDEAVEVLAKLLADVERQEGLAMAQRVAMAEAGNLQAQKDCPAAVKAYELTLSRYPQGTFVVEAMYQLGDCSLELHDYAAAESVWRKLIDENGDASMAPWAWRKLALAQLLQTHYDQSLATLEAMAGKYAGTEFEEYARMRRGYVLASAGRTQEAQAAYQAFLKEFPRSKYCGLASQQMAELDRGRTLARARQ